jgi:ATP-dependent DNA helicase RecQ
VGSLEKSDVILQKTTEAIQSGAVEPNRITITVLVIDEAQDMSANEYHLITTLMEKNEEMRVIAVGDDDQNIYEFRGSSSRHLEHFIQSNHATNYELLENFRSKSNLVMFTNQFVAQIRHRLKHTPIIAKQTDNGSIKVVRYQHGNLIMPLVQDVLETELSGSTCVLSRTNDEALQITGLLLKLGLPAKLIQSNDGFNLHQLLEVRFLLDLLKRTDEHFISNDLWTESLRELSARFHKSRNMAVVRQIASDFETTNPKRKFKSDLDVFIRESKLEDLLFQDREMIYVSTMHKAKGKEFDNVFLMLENFTPVKDEEKRQVYVAMTRAKQNLAIHLNSGFLDNCIAEDVVRRLDQGTYPPPAHVAMHLSMEDLHLDDFFYTQREVDALISGDLLKLSDLGCRNDNNQPVLAFSKKFVAQIEHLREKHYRPGSASVNHIVYWRKEGAEREVKVVLPEISFERSG